MRLAIFSDIHGNDFAFETVEVDIKKHNVDQLVCLGDAIQGGPQPATQSSVNQLNQKTAPRNAGLFFCQLVRHGDVASLRSFGSLFDCELDLLTFLQVAETIALNGGEMDKNVLAAFALDEAEALRSIEPLDCTGNSFRHCICLLWQK